jgi:excisionase family DNA binding protein
MYLASPEFQPKPQPVLEVILVTTKQAAQALQVSERTIANLIKSGKLHSTLIGTARRIDLNDLRRLASGKRETRGRKPKAGV